MMNDLGLAKTQPTFDEFTAAVNNCTKIISPVRRKFHLLSSLVYLSGTSSPGYNNNDRLTAFDPGQPG